MVSGTDLVGEAVAARKRGRPKGSTNKRSRELQGVIASVYGATAAQQSAAFCMVRPAELRAAGGSMAQAQVAKAMDLVQRVRQAQDLRDEGVRAIVRQALADLVVDMPGAEGKALRELVAGFIGRVKEGTAGFGLVAAMKMLADERAALLPYTDQKQPLAVDVTAKAAPAPSVVIMGAGPAIASSVEKAEVFEGAFEEVSPPKSHDLSQGAEIPGLLASPATD